MRCERAREAVQEVLLRRPASGLELAVLLPAQAQGHLRDCASCREAARDLLALDRMLWEAPEPDMPADLVAGVMARVREAPPEAEPAPAAAWRPWVAAVLVLIAAGLAALAPVAHPYGIQAWTWVEPLAAEGWASLDAALVKVRALVPAWESAPASRGSVAMALGLIGAAAIVHWRVGPGARHA